MFLFCIFWVLSIFASCLIEHFTQPASPLIGKIGSVVVFRLALASLVFGLFFVFSWRPGFSAFATSVFYAVWTVITRAKSWYVYEPVVFSDLAILVDIFRFPKLFYAKFINFKMIVFVLAALVATIGCWFWFEPSILPSNWPGIAIIFGLLVWLGFAILPFIASIRQFLGRWAMSIIPKPNYERDISRHGFMVSFVLYALCWLKQRREGAVTTCNCKHELTRRADSAELIIIVQSESFYDLRHLGIMDIDLPGLDVARQKAIACGRLQSHVLGGYTLRSEFSMLTGLAPDDIGFDRFYPYLNASTYGSRSLASLLKKEGYSTHFLHPFHANFFSRNSALPKLGFEHLQMLDAFANAPICGNYVCDDAVADRIIEISKMATKTPQFIFAATMENHGPWEQGRLSGEEDQVEIYKHHLRNADAMLIKLMSFLEQRCGRSVLLFYGDHVPILKTIANPFPDDLTDYVLMEWGGSANMQALELSRDIQQLPGDILRAAGLISY